MRHFRLSRSDIQRTLIIIVCVALLAALGWVLFSEQGQRLVWPGGLGFDSYTPPAKAPPPTGFVRGKTLYDWLQLLIIPVVLALAGLLYNRSEKRLEQKLANERAAYNLWIAEEQRQDATLQAYFDRIEALLLPPHNLRQWKESGAAGEAARDMARVRTLTALRQLDATRRNVLLQFLRDAHLVDNDGEKSIIDFRNVNLAIVDLRWTNFNELDFTNANLYKAQLQGTSFLGTKLRGAQLQGAFLVKASLQFASLWMAQLQHADLSMAMLKYANLSDAYMQHANLSGAQLQGANLSGAQLQGARLDDDESNLEIGSLERAILDGADLTNSNITVAQLWQVRSFKGAKLPPEVELQLRQARSLKRAKLPPEVEQELRPAAPADDGKEVAAPRHL